MFTFTTLASKRAFRVLLLELGDYEKCTLYIQYQNNLEIRYKCVENYFLVTFYQFGHPGS
jgi:hypothetical protein